jgi:hypothetical protein
LALLGRRPHQRVEGHVIAGVRETYTGTDLQHQIPNAALTVANAP